jgi:hypothetical protein
LQKAGKFLLGFVLLRLGQFLLADVLQHFIEIRFDVEVIKDDQSILRMLPGRGEKPSGAVTDKDLDCFALLFGQALVEDIEDALAVLFVVPDNGSLVDVHHVGDVGMSLFPGYFVNAYGLRRRRRYEKVSAFS